MIVVRLNGGLGNQLFQVCSALNLRGCFSEIYFDCSKVNMSSLEALIGSLNKVDAKEADRVGGLTGYNIIDRLLKRVYRMYPDSFSRYKYWGSDRDNHLLEGGVAKDLLLDGYWQDLRFSSDSLLIIKKMIKEKARLSKHFNQYDALISQKCSVSVHVRRGDYTDDRFKGKFDVCDVEYYVSAIKKILELKGADVHFYFFTNDVDWVKEHLIDYTFAHTFVSGEALADYEEMLLIGRAECAIIPNSTFSWWGVSLSSICDHVVCPKSWFVDYDRPGLIDSRWHRI